MEDWLADSMRGAVATAQAAKAGMSSAGETLKVVHAPWIGPGRDDYGAPTARPAVVERGAVLARAGSAAVQTTGTRVEFLGPVPAHGATGRQEPVDPRDRITVPGAPGPGHVLEVPPGAIDPATRLPFVSVVWLA